MKTAIVTGVSRGIGKAIAELLLENNYKVFGTSTSGKSDIDHTNFTCFELRLESEDSIAKFTKQLTGQKIDALVNNAAVFLDHSVDQSKYVDLLTLRKTFEINCFGQISLTEKLIKNIPANSNIVNVTSNWGSFSDQFFDEFYPHYKISKTAFSMYSKLLAERLRDKNICVSVWDPIWVNTDMGPDGAPREPEEVSKEVLDLIENDVETGKFWRDGKVRGW